MKNVNGLGKMNASLLYRYNGKSYILLNVFITVRCPCSISETNAMREIIFTKQNALDCAV